MSPGTQPVASTTAPMGICCSPPALMVAVYRPGAPSRLTRLAFTSTLILGLLVTSAMSPSMPVGSALR